MIEFTRPIMYALDDTLTMPGYGADAKAVGDAIAKIEKPELAGYVTQEDIKDLATKEEVNEAVSNVEVDLTGYAKTTDIPSLEGYAKTTDIPSLEGYAKTEDIPSLEGYAKTTDIPSLEGYAKTTDIPDVSEYQTEAQVNALIETALGVVENGTY
jgi:hypothetical protein